MKGIQKKKEMIRGADTGVSNLTHFSGLLTDSIINSPDKAAVFPSFSDTKIFIASSVIYPSPGTFSLDYSKAIFDTCGNNGGDSEEEEMIWGTYTGVSNLTHF